jgi:hypothetical protein
VKRVIGQVLGWLALVAALFGVGFLIHGAYQDEQREQERLSRLPVAERCLEEYGSYPLQRVPLWCANALGVTK